jgi:hypothetical protein
MMPPTMMMTNKIPKMVRVMKFFIFSLIGFSDFFSDYSE